MSIATLSRPAPQRLGGVFRAELRSAMRQGGLRVGFAVAFMAGLALGVPVMLFIRYLTFGQIDETPWVPVTIPVEATASCAGVIIAIGVVLHVGRNMQNGSIQTALTCVPRRTRLLMAQYAATALGAALVTAAAATVIAIAALIRTPSALGLGTSAVGIISGALAAALTATLAQSIALLLGRGMAAVMVLMTWWIVAPLLLSLAGTLLPGPLASVFSTLAEWTPLAIQVKATTISTLPVNGYSSILQALAVLLALAAGMATFAHWRLSRRDF